MKSFESPKQDAERVKNIVLDQRQRLEGAASAESDKALVAVASMMAKAVEESGPLSSRGLEESTQYFTQQFPSVNDTNRQSQRLHLD